MVKHNQTIHRFLRTNCLSVFLPLRVFLPHGLKINSFQCGKRSKKRWFLTRFELEQWMRIQKLAKYLRWNI